MIKRSWLNDWELCQKATPGKWEVEVSSINGPYSIRMPFPKGKKETFYGVQRIAWKEDAEFIAMAREALPYWLKRVEELEYAIAELEKQVNK